MNSRAATTSSKVGLSIRLLWRFFSQSAWEVAFSVRWGVPSRSAWDVLFSVRMGRTFSVHIGRTFSVTWDVPFSVRMGLFSVRMDVPLGPHGTYLLGPHGTYLLGPHGTYPFLCHMGRTVGAALRVFIIMTSFTDRYHDMLYS